MGMKSQVNEQLRTQGPIYAKGLDPNDPQYRDKMLRNMNPDYAKAIKSGQYQAAMPIDPATGQPLRPTFDPLTDVNGNLQSKYKLSAPVDMRGMEAMRQEALRTGPSQWATLQKASQADEIAARGAGATNQALTGMRTGGLSGGSRERIFQNAQANQLLQGQQSSRDIAVADEQKRMNALQQLPGQELALSGFNRDTDQANIGTLINDTTQKRMFDTNNYNEQMRAWAAQRTAAATPKSGKK